MWRGEKAIVIRIIGNSENVTILAPIMADCGCVGLICGRLCRLVCSKFVFAKVGILNSVFQNRCLSKLVCFPESFSQIDVPESMIPNIDFPKLFPTIGFPELVFFPKDWLFKTVFPPGIECSELCVPHKWLVETVLFLQNAYFQTVGFSVKIC